MLLVSPPYLICHDADFPILPILTSLPLSKWRSFPYNSLGNYFTDRHWAQYFLTCLFLLECRLVEFSVCFPKQPPNLCRLLPFGTASLFHNAAEPSSSVISSAKLPPPKPAWTRACTALKVKWHLVEVERQARMAFFCRTNYSRNQEFVAYGHHIPFCCSIVSL